MHLHTLLLVLILVKCETDAAKCFMLNALKTGLPHAVNMISPKNVYLFTGVRQSGCGVFQQTAEEAGA